MKRLLGDWITDLEGTCDLLALDGQRQRYAYFGFTPGSEKYTFYLDVANVPVARVKYLLLEKRGTLRLHLCAAVSGKRRSGRRGGSLCKEAE